VSNELDFVFMPRVAEALRAERGDAYRGEMSMSGAYPAMPVAGDLFSDCRISRRMFVVVNRWFLWDENSKSYGLQLLLDLAPDNEMPLAFAIVPPANS